jgi:hypothetical protein
MKLGHVAMLLQELVKKREVIIKNTKRRKHESGSQRLIGRSCSSRITSVVRRQ